MSDYNILMMRMKLKLEKAVNHYVKLNYVDKDYTLKRY